MILISGQNLQRRYSNGSESGIKTNSQLTQQKNDHNALRNASKAKRAQREARQELRMKKNISVPKQVEIGLKEIDLNPLEGINVNKITSNLKENTNALAREYDLPEPNNPEALKHDRKHCVTCNRKLDSPHKADDFDNLFNEDEIRLLCCWCFGKMGESEIKSTMKSGKTATKEIRLKVYNPEESTKAEIESLIDTKRIQLKSKLKKWNQDVSLVGNIKHDYLLEGDQIENSVLYNAKSRYTACTL